MKFLQLLLIILLTIKKVICSSQNHTPTELVLLILAAADEKCIHEESCGPRINSKTGKPYEIDISNESNKNVPTMASIYDLIPELRILSEEEAKNYFTKVLFPSAKKAFNSYIGISNYENLSGDEKNELTEVINKALDKQDIIKELLRNKNNDPVSFLEHNNERNLHFLNGNKLNNKGKETLNTKQNELRIQQFHQSIIDYITNDDKNNSNFKYKQNVLDEKEYKIPVEAVSEIMKICKSRITCKNYFKNLEPKDFNFSIMESIDKDNIKNYHFFLNDIKNNRLIHPFTLKNDSKDNYSVNTEYNHKEVYYYDRIKIPKDKIAIITSKILNQFINGKNEDGKNEDGNLYNKISNSLKITNKITSSDKFKDKAMNTLNTEYSNKIFDNISNILDNNNIEATNYDKQRLTNDIIKEIINLYMNNNNYDIKDFNKVILGTLSKEYALSNNENNILFDFDLVKEALQEEPQLTNEENKKLYNMLKQYTTLGENEDDLKSIYDTLSGNGKKITNEQLRSKLTSVLMHQSFNENFVSNLNSISFADSDINRRTIQTKINNFGRDIIHPFRSGNDCKLTSPEYDLMVKCGFVFVDAKDKKGNNIYIPQENDIDLGKFTNFYNVKGYCHSDVKNNGDKDVLNGNAINKYLQNSDKQKNNLKNFINAFTNSQTNLNLYSHLNSLYNTLKANPNYLISDGTKMKNPNHWRDDKLLHNINDIFRSSHNDVINLSTLLLELDQLKIGLSIDIDKLATKLANQYCIQQDYNPNNENINKGLKLEGKGFNKLLDTIKDNLNKKENIDYYMSLIQKNYIRAYAVRSEANKIISNIDNLNNIPSISYQLNRINNDPNDKLNSNILNNLKNNYNNIHDNKGKTELNINFDDTFICADSKQNAKSFPDLSSKFIDTMYDKNHNTDESSKALALSMMKGTYFKSLNQHMYPITREGQVKGISTDRSHITRMKIALNILKNIISKSNKNAPGCFVHSMIKRDSTSNSCSKPPSINSNEDISIFTIETLKGFKNKNIDSKILPLYNDIDDIKNVKVLHENAESISDVWKELTDTYYKYINEFTESESEAFLNNFNIVINEYKEMISNSKYNNSPYIQNMTSDMIDKMETYLNKAYNYHYEHFDNNNDNNNDEELLCLTSYTKNSQSKYYKEKLIHTINNIVSIINQNDGNPVYGLGIKYNSKTVSSEIDPNTIIPNSININDAINKLCDKIKYLDDSYNDQLIQIYNNLSDLYSINDIEYGNNQYASINSELVHKLYNVVANKISIENSTEENIKTSDNILKVPGLEHVENENLINTIKENSISAEDKKYILKGMEHHINNFPSKNLDKQLYNTINNINTFINNQIEQLNKFSSYIGHELATANIVSLSSAYNDLVATAIYNNKIYSNDINNNLPINVLEFDNEFNNRVNFVMNRQLNEAILTIAKNNPSLYNSDVEINSGNKFSWGGNIVYEASNSILVKLTKNDNSFTSRSEFTFNLINHADSSSYTTLKQSFELKYNYVNYQSPASRDQNHINDIEHNYSKLGFKHIQKNIQSIDIYHSTQFFAALSVVSTYNPNLTPLSTEDDNKNIVNVKTMYKGASNYKEMFTEMNKFENDLKNNNKLTNEIKTQIDDASNKFTTDIQVTSYKLAKMAGRESQNTFSTFTNEFSSVANYVSGYLKNNAHLSNNGRTVPQFKYNQNTLNLAHNHNLNTHSINKNNKELRISSSKANKLIGSTKKT